MPKKDAQNDQNSAVAVDAQGEKGKPSADDLDAVAADQKAAEATDSQAEDPRIAQLQSQVDSLKQIIVGKGLALPPEPSPELPGHYKDSGYHERPEGEEWSEPEPAAPAPVTVAPKHHYGDTATVKTVPVCSVCKTDQNVGLFGDENTPFCKMHAPRQPRHIDSRGIVFDPKVHAMDGAEPYKDSTGSFVSKELAYTPPKASAAFGDTGR